MTYGSSTTVSRLRAGLVAPEQAGGPVAGVVGGRRSRSSSSGSRPTEKPKPVWVSLALARRWRRPTVARRPPRGRARMPVVRDDGALDAAVAVVGRLDAGGCAGRRAAHAAARARGPARPCARSGSRPAPVAAQVEVGGGDAVGLGQAEELVGRGERRRCRAPRPASRRARPRRGCRRRRSPAGRRRSPGCRRPADSADDSDSTSPS